MFGSSGSLVDKTIDEIKTETAEGFDKHMKKMKDMSDLVATLQRVTFCFVIAALAMIGKGGHFAYDDPIRVLVCLTFVVIGVTLYFKLANAVTYYIFKEYYKKHTKVRLGLTGSLISLLMLASVMMAVFSIIEAVISHGHF